MDVLLWVVFGLAVGIVAKLLIGRDLVVTIVLGIVGGLLGGWLGRVLEWYGEGESVGFVMAVIGAIVVLALYRLIGGNRAGI